MDKVGQGDMEMMTPFQEWVFFREANPLLARRRPHLSGSLTGHHGLNEQVDVDFDKLHQYADDISSARYLGSARCSSNFTTATLTRDQTALEYDLDNLKNRSISTGTSRNSEKFKFKNNFPALRSSSSSQRPGTARTPFTKNRNRAKKQMQQRSRKTQPGYLGHILAKNSSYGRTGSLTGWSTMNVHSTQGNSRPKQPRFY